MKYYLHDTSAFDDEKITDLYLNFGYEGLGLFYTCLEKIAKQEKPIKTTVLKAQLKVGKRLEKCWSFMEEIGLICSSNGESFNEQLLNFSEKYQIKKEKTRIKVSQWREKQQVKEDVTSYETVSNLPKVKKSKVKESKVNNNDAIASDENSVYKKFTENWFNFYEQKTGVKPKFNGVDGSALKSIISHFEKLCIEKNSDPAEAWQYLLTNWGRLDEWHQDKCLDLKVLSSKMNVVINQLKNGSKGKQKSNTASRTAYFKEHLPGYGDL